VPLVLLVPVQPPEAVQDVALVELQVNVEDAPLASVVWLADSMAVGTGLAVTVTVAAAAALVPPEPMQVSEYVVSAVKAPVLWLPLVANAPVQPPEALHDVASVELQANIAASPLLTVIGDAVIDAVGTGGFVVTGTDPDPPQAARSSDAPIAIPGVRRRIGVFSDSRIMFGSRAASSVIPQQNLLIHRSMEQRPLANMASAMRSTTWVPFQSIGRRVSERVGRDAERVWGYGRD
jgi:hypothetical protein